MRHVPAALLLTLAASGAHAAMSCADVRYGSAQYRSNMQLLARNAKLPGGTFTKYHERIVNDLCQDDAEDTRKLVDLGYVSAQEVAAIKRVLQAKDATAVATAPQATAPTQADPRDLPAMNRAVDAMFTLWGRQWMWDRYIPDSAVITENQLKNGYVLVRGTFRFSRGGGVAAIPFASALRRKQDDWNIADLCYNDTTSGMTDCVNSGITPATRRFMSMIVIGGVLAAMSGGDSHANASNQDRIDADSDRQQRDREERDHEESRREKEASDREYESHKYDPNPYLDPPQTLK